MTDEQPVEEPTEEEQPITDPTDDMDLDLIEKANEAAERIEKANKRLEYNIARMEKVQVEKILGGKASTNMPPQEETAKDYAKKVMANEI